MEIAWSPALRGYDFGPQHPFRMSYRGLAVELLRELDPSTFELPTGLAAARREELVAFHTEDYLAEVESAGADPGGPPLDAGDTPRFEGCYEASAAVVGATLSATRSIVEKGGRAAFAPGGGLHHAHPSRASGFCVLNDLAVAISLLTGPGDRLRPVAYIDIDAHHGDGVMYGVYESGRLLDIDFHQDGRTLFPGTGAVRATGRGDGAGLKVNVPVPPGTGEADFRPLFLALVPPMLREYRPELIVLQHGVDGHLGDPLASLSYGPSCYDLAVRRLRELADELCGGRLVVTGGGGYRPEHVARVLARAGRQLSGLPLPDGPLPPAWRGEFSEAFGRPAPDRWTDEEPSGIAPPPTPAATRILTELSEALGRRFPAPG